MATDGTPDTTDPIDPAAPVPPLPTAASPVVGVFGSTERAGRWRPARRQTVVAVFGGVQLDLRDAELPPDVLEIRAWAVFGGVRLSLPEGMRVETTGGLSIFGGSSARTTEAPATSDLPVLRLHAVAVFGGVLARTETTPPRAG